MRRSLWLYLSAIVALLALGTIGLLIPPVRAQLPAPAPAPSGAAGAPQGCFNAAWTARSPMGIPLDGNAVAAQGGLIYSFGGDLAPARTPLAGAGRTPTGLAFSYDPATDTWNELPSMPGPAYGASAVSDGTYIYIIGGAPSYTTLYRYDPADDSYATLTSSTTGSSFQAAVYTGGRIYKFGGCDPAGCPTAIASVEYYYIFSNSWTAVTPLPQALAAPLAVTDGSAVYLAGGYLSGGAGSATTYRFDTEIYTWDDAAVTDLPAPRAAGATGVLNDNRWIVAGGLFGNLNSTLALDLNTPTGAWQTMPDLPAGRYNLGGAASGDSLYAIAGLDAESLQTDDTQIYTEAPCATGTPATDTPTATPVPSDTATTVPTSTQTPPTVPTATGTPPPTVPPSSTPTLPASAVPTGTATPIPAASSTPLPSDTPAASPTATPTGTWTPTPTAEPQPVIAGPGEQTAPAVDGQFVVWEDNSAGTWDVEARDLTTGRVIAIATGPGDQRHPAISGNLIAWQDNAAGPWAIYGRYLSGDTPGPVFLIAGGSTDQTNPALSGHQVVWQSADAGAASRPAGVGRWSVVYGDLDSGQVLTLTTASTTNINPVIDGNFVVWQSIVPTDTLQSPQGVGRWTLDGYDIGASRTFTVTDAPGDQVNPAISGDTVVWQTYQSAAEAPDGVGRWTVEGSSVDGSGYFVITTNGDEEQNPAIDGPLVVVQDEAPGLSDARPDGVGRWSIIVVNRNTGASQTVSNDPGDATLPAISGGTIVWSQTGEDGTQDVYDNLCLPAFADVTSADYFAPAVDYLACRGVLSGYANGTFRPYAEATRGQLAKMVVLAQDWTSDTSGGPHFTDVPVSHPFYSYIETAYHHGVISGYADGRFLPYNPTTRGQFCKIVVAAQGWAIDTSGGPHFTDVPASDPFYAAVETAYHHGVISGYADGTFRPHANITRGQIAKIIDNALFAP